MARSTLSLAFEPYLRLDLRLPLLFRLLDFRDEDLRDDDLPEDDFRDDDFRRAFFVAMITPFLTISANRPGHTRQDGDTRPR